MEDVLIVVLRAVHILLGTLWFGFGMLAMLILHPAAERMGERGLTLLRLFYGYTRFGIAMPIVSIGTTLAGVILWLMRSDGLTDLVAFTSTGDLVMIVGAVAGLAAFGHGVAATGKYSEAFAKASIAYDENPSDENMTALKAAKTKLDLHGRISGWMMLVAIVCMTSARYLA